MIFKKKKKDILNIERINLGLPKESKTDAIRRVGNILYEAGCVEETYIDGMIKREEVATTYIGSSVAIPHGTNESKQYVLETGLAVLQYPEGVDFGDGNIAYLVIGIAASGDEHLDILMNIAEAISDNDTLNMLIKTTDKRKIFDTFNQNDLGGK